MELSASSDRAERTETPREGTPHQPCWRWNKDTHFLSDLGSWDLLWDRDLRPWYFLPKGELKINYCTKSLEREKENSHLLLACCVRSSSSLPCSVLL